MQGAEQFSSVKPRAVQFSSVQYITMQYYVVQCIVVQSSLVQFALYKTVSVLPLIINTLTLDTQPQAIFDAQEH